MPQTTSVPLRPLSGNVRLQRFHPKWTLEWAGGPICKIRVSGKLVNINFFNNDFLQFPDLNREYCVKRGSLAPGQLDAGLPYCSSTEADLRRMKRELYSPGPMDMEGLYPLERKMLLPPQRAFSPDLQEICYPRARRDILSIEREIDERTWAQLEGRMRSPVPIPSHSYSTPRSLSDFSRKITFIDFSVIFQARSGY